MGGGEKGEVAAGGRGMKWISKSSGSLNPSKQTWVHYSKLQLVDAAKQNKTRQTKTGSLTSG